MAAKHWCFTLNNWTEEELGHLRLASLDDNFAFIGWAQEVAPSTGTPHLQGSFSLVKKKRSTALHKLPGFARISLQVMKGTPRQAYAYYADNEDKSDPVGLETYGELPRSGQGSRTDIDGVVHLLKDGAPLAEVAETYPMLWMRYHNGIRSYATIVRRRDHSIRNGPYPWDVTFSGRTLLLWGRAGIGKTEFAKSLLPRGLFISHLDDLVAYDARTYDGIIMDDMSFQHLPRESQIHLVDYDNPRSIHVRYTTAYIPAHTKKIILTNRLPSEVLLVGDAAISRRLDIRELIAPGDQSLLMTDFYEAFRASNQ